MIYQRKAFQRTIWILKVNCYIKIAANSHAKSIINEINTCWSSQLGMNNNTNSLHSYIGLSLSIHIWQWDGTNASSNEGLFEKLESRLLLLWHFRVIRSGNWPLTTYLGAERSNHIFTGLLCFCEMTREYEKIRQTDEAVTNPDMRKGDKRNRHTDPPNWA